MKNKALLVAIALVAVIAAGRMMTAPRQQAEESTAETGADDYEEINAEIMELIAELEQGAFNATQPGDELSIELFELDPENEELGEVY
jgi:type II secretory pathway component PulJ